MKEKYESNQSHNEKIKIPKVTYEDGYDKLLERVSKFKKGTLRIVFFMIVGMIIGWLSYTYPSDPFLVTKVILAIPYKISETIYVSVIGTNASSFYTNLFDANEFFPQSGLATFLSERITPVLIGGALCGSLAYFTGDKRVFTLRRFVKFAGIQTAVILLFIAGVYGINSKAVYDNDHFKGVTNFILTSPSKEELICDDKSDNLLTAFEQELTEDASINASIKTSINASIKPDSKNIIPIGIVYENGIRNMEAFVNTKKMYLITVNGLKYHISKEFAEYVQQYYETGTIEED